MGTKLQEVKVFSFWSCEFQALCSSEHTFARASTFLSWHAIAIFELLIGFFKGSFSNSRQCISRNHGITDALKKNAHDQNEQTILTVFVSKGELKKKHQIAV